MAYLAERLFKDKSIMHNSRELGKQLILAYKQIDELNDKIESLNNQLSEIDIPECDDCSIKMVKRISNRDYNYFWACKNFPYCKSAYVINLNVSFKEPAIEKVELINDKKTIKLNKTLLDNFYHQLGRLTINNPFIPVCDLIKLNKCGLNLNPPFLKRLKIDLREYIEKKTQNIFTLQHFKKSKHFFGIIKKEFYVKDYDKNLNDYCDVNNEHENYNNELNKLILDIRNSRFKIAAEECCKILKVIP